jgi:hemolysin activation/secretion protein
MYRSEMKVCTQPGYRLMAVPLLGIVGLLGLLSSPVLLAAPPVTTLPGVVDRPPLELPPVLSGERVEIPVTRPQPLQVPTAGGATVATLSRVTFGGSLLLKREELQKVVAPFLHRPITINDIARMKYELTSLYFRHGYVLVKVTTPPQNLSGGVLRVIVVAGRIGNVTTSNDALSERIAATRLAPLRSGEVFNERTVESALQDINDLNNVRSSVSLRPGTETGTTDLDVQIHKSATDQDVQLFTLDNYGSKFTGKTVARLSLQKSNLLGAHETLGLTARKSWDDFWAMQGDAVIPLPLRNLKLELDYLRSDNSIGDVFAALDSSGESEVYQAALSSALINQQQRKLVVRGGIERGNYKSLLAGVPATSDTIARVYAEGSYTMRKSRLVSFFSLRASRGVSALGADDKGDADASRLTGDPRAWTIESLLYGNFRVSDRDYVQAVVQAQHANTVVLSSDLFTIGGYGSVRGYQPAQSTGDSGISVNLDGYRQFNMPENWYAQAGPFVDYGYVHNRVAGSAPETNLWSAGLGVEFNYRHTGKLASKLRLDWAHPFADTHLPQVDSNTFYARFTQLF